MKAEKQEYTITEVKLTLSAKEAQWLKAIVQNPPCINESEQDRQLRMELWNALDEKGI